MILSKILRSYDFPTREKQLDLTLKFLNLLLLSNFMIATLLNPSLSDALQWNMEESMLIDDTLAIEIRPAVENLWVNYSSPKSSGIRVAVFSNETRDMYRFSLVYVMPRTEGTYNIVVKFNSKGAWNCTVGVYTRKSEFYKKPPIMTSSGPYIPLSGPFGVTAKGNQTAGYEINIVLQVEGEDSSGWFFIKFPTPVNMALFAIISFAVAYFNAFFFLDAYFKNKVEGLSKIRLALLVLMLLASIYFLYQIHVFMVGE
ncbi:hypothetical protein KEJ43_02845 [Candidatus Bathyarchaeota archaeon]|nr:hypothetical protein [Candidatus Bathyarchaeota archaeon]